MLLQNILINKIQQLILSFVCVMQTSPRFDAKEP